MKPDVIGAFADIAREEGIAPPPDPRHVSRKAFRPSLNPIQGQAYDSEARYNLLHGERYSGKTISAIHKMVSYCREERNGRALLLTGLKRQAEEGGAWDKLQTMVLPAWKQGCNLEWDGPHGNTSKDIFIWVANKHGGWSKILLLSMPVEGFVADRVKGMEFGFIMVDEAQTLESDTYFSTVVQQLGRRQFTVKPQIYYCANPEGPSHWLYHRFFEIPVILYEDGTQEWNDDYAVFHIPISDNKHNLPSGYWESVIEATKDDDTEYRRMVLGEWVDAPTGDALFREDFIEAVHMRGDVVQKSGIVPVRNVPIIEGYDLGSAHSSVTLEQMIATKDKLVWIVFDEIVTVDQYVPYVKLVPEILKRREYWNQRVGAGLDWISISDNSAFNQFRAKTGSFDAQDIEAISGGKIKLRECPKGPFSVESRIRQTKEKLHTTSLYISAPTCPKTREMFMKLEQDKDDRFKPKRSRFLHPYDSMSYPHFYYQTHQTTPKVQVGEIKPEYYACGR